MLVSPLAGLATEQRRHALPAASGPRRPSGRPHAAAASGSLRQASTSSTFIPAKLVSISLVHPVSDTRLSVSSLNGRASAGQKKASGQASNWRPWPANASTTVSPLRHAFSTAATWASMFALVGVRPATLDDAVSRVTS